jgi:hypothetical protein
MAAFVVLHCNINSLCDEMPQLSHMALELRWYLKTIKKAGEIRRPP